MQEDMAAPFPWHQIQLAVFEGYLGVPHVSHDSQRAVAATKFAMMEHSPDLMWQKGETRMKRLSQPFVIALLILALAAMIAPAMAAEPAAKVFSDFVQVRDLVSEMQDKVPLNREWSLVYCECKNGKVVAVPVQGSATEIDRALCEQKSRAHGGCRLEARIMKIGPSKNRLEAYSKKEEAAKRQRALDEEQYRQWRSQPSSTPSSPSATTSSDTQWMSRDDYQRQKEQEAADEAAAKKRARKQRVDELKDAAKEKVYRGILGQPEYVKPYNFE